MRNLAKLECSACSRTFYGDLPAGHGLGYPVLLETGTGEVFNLPNSHWFAHALKRSYAERVDAPVSVSVEKLWPPQRPILVNCLDLLYGHCLLKLLNIQYYLDRHPDLDVIVLIPSFLRWMVPDGVAEIWTVHWSLRDGARWNDRLAALIRGRIEEFSECMLSTALSHPNQSDFAIERFTGVIPFALETWMRGESRPAVTFIWREDRLWDAGRLQVVSELAGHLRGSGNPISYSQSVRVARLASLLRQSLPGIDFAVAGLGKSSRLPFWIKDLRCEAPGVETERSWCARYARSHVVIGVHGSNMLLPSAHAGATVDLMPPDRWGNFGQDVLFRDEDARESALRHRFLPILSSPRAVAQIVHSLISDFPDLRDSMSKESSSHRFNGRITA